MGASASQPVAAPVVSEKTDYVPPTKRDPTAAELLSQLSLRSSASPSSGTVTPSHLSTWESAFSSSPKHRLASTVLSKTNFTEALVSRKSQAKDQQVFNVKLSSEGTPVTNQKSSGRCWLFAATNCIRIAMMRKYDLEDFQLSQSYLFFVDSLSKANYFLENMLELAEEPLDDRTVQYLMEAPENDGGQWDMAVNLMETFGLVPHCIFPESFNSSATGKIDTLVTSKLREFALELRELHAAAMRTLADVEGNSCAAKKAIAVQSARKRKEEQMGEIYRVLAITLGAPPKPTDPFVWEYYSKDKKYHRVEATPLSFYKDFALVDVSRAISLIHDPRNKHGLYTVERLGNVWGARPVLYVNTDIGKLKETAIRLLKADIPVWFGSDVGKCSSSALGIMDTALYDLDEGFGTTLRMSKAQRLQTGDSSMTHAMVLTAVHLENGKPVRWRVENSWGADACDKGYMLMSDEWFDQFVYQIVADRKYIDKALVDVFEHGEPTVLPPWDPMGSLA
ncbi:hypothetical protein JCM21900_003321 [Sporobolomyces salmonicolor]